MILSRLSFVYIFSFLLLYIINQQQSESISFFRPKKTPLFIQAKRNELRDKFNNVQMAELLLSYMTGEKKRLSKKIKKSHRLLSLYHLFTPSGIHLSSLYLFLAPLLFYISKISQKAHFLLSIALCSVPYFLPGFYSMKRISLLRLFNLLTKKLKKLKKLRKLPFRPDIFHIFLCTFLIDFFFGTYQHSPQSFAYSFLFLGIILSTPSAKGRLPFALLGGQLIISFFQLTPITGIGFFLGFLLTALFCFVFPLLFVYFWISYLTGGIWGEYIVLAYWKLVSLGAIISSKSGFYYGTIPAILLFIIFSMKLSKKIKIVFMIFLMIIHSGPLLNLPKSAHKKNPNPDRALKLKRIHKFKDRIINIERTRRGLKATYINGYVCYFKLYNHFYEHRCKKKKARNTRP